MIKFIRWVLALALIYGAYTETGMWTAISLFLILIAIEFHSYLIKGKKE